MNRKEVFSDDHTRSMEGSGEREEGVKTRSKRR